ncbi:MAG: hypothetical protein RL316_1197, partial [Bacteroidota bacterium]
MDRAASDGCIIFAPMENLQKIIQEAWSNRDLVKQTNTQDAIRAVIEEVDMGRIRVASP